MAYMGEGDNLAVFKYSTDSGKIEYVNRLSKKVLGLHFADFSGEFLWIGCDSNGVFVLDHEVNLLQEHSAATYYGEILTCKYNPTVGVLTVSLDSGILEYHVEVDKKQLHLTNFYEKHDEHIDKTMHALR